MGIAGNRTPAAERAVVALANKITRMIWVLLAHDRTYRDAYVSSPA